MNSDGGYFLVRESDKKCGEHKNWVKILRSDSNYLSEKNAKNGEYKNKELGKILGFDGKKVGEYKNFEAQLMPCPSMRVHFYL